MVKAVVFDLDDTLISESDYIKSGYFCIAEVIENKFKMNKIVVYDELLELFNDCPINVFNRFLDKHHIKYTDKTIQNLVSEYRMHFPDIDFYDDVIPCLGELKNLGIKTGIITDGYKIAQRQKIKSIKAHMYFDEIIVTDEFGREYWKPHPKAFEYIKEKLKVNFDEMIYIGDNPEKDFYIQKYYPITTIRILRGGIHKDKRYFDDIREDFQIKNLEELKYIISNKI